MQNEQIVAVATDAAKKWMLIQSIIGTHGLSKELEGIAILLLVRGHDQAEVLRAVEEIRNSAGARDEALRHLREAEQALQHARKLLDQEDTILYYSEDHLRLLVQAEPVAKAELAEEVVEAEAEEVDLGDLPDPVSRGRY